MKKNFALILCVIMLFSCTVLTACGKKEIVDLSESKYIGTWQAVSMTNKDISKNETTLTVNADGTAQLTAAGQNRACEWEETYNGFRFTKGARMTFTDDGNGIKASDAGNIIRFERQQ